ncbi:MAG: FAD-binding oxidoreductase [Dongiaceae bacterium]
MTASLYTNDFKETPYWWDQAPRPTLPDTVLPERIDVLIVGSGYTGLSAGLETARGGRSTLIVDAEEAGWGCSSRNGGQVSTSIKPGLAKLTGKYGASLAFEMRREGHRALDYMEDFIRREGLKVNWERVGRFHAAHNPRRYEIEAQALKSIPKELKTDAYAVPRSEQHSEIGSDAYYGGIVMPHHAALHPAKYENALVSLARQAGVMIVTNCRVTGIVRESGGGFSVTTARGTVKAREVIVATNGYTGEITPWQRRRIIPIGSYIIATDDLTPELAKELVPNARTLSDTRRLIFYYRLSHDRKKILFGGRVAYMETDPKVSAPRLHDHMTRIFPQLKATRVSHSWVGFVAYTFDTLPHIGQHDGLYYAMGYCGSGVSLASYFGMRLGQKLLGKPEGKTPFDNCTFETRPLYTGFPWFLAPSIMWYRILDRLPI